MKGLDQGATHQSGLPSRTKHLGFLDGMRALAALHVTLYHVWLFADRAMPAGLLGLMLAPLLYGHLAVDVFIVLSGFCLMLPVARSGSLRGGGRDFLRRRCRRILPTLYAAIGVALCVQLLVMVHAHWWNRGAVRFLLKAMALSLLLIQDLAGQAGINGALWTVDLEFKIYFLFPVLVLLWQRRQAGAMFALSIAAAFLLAGCALLFQRDPVWNDFCPWYTVLFLFGLFAADISVRGTNSIHRLWLWGLGGLTALWAAWLWPFHGFSATDTHFHLSFDTNLGVADVLTGAATAALLLILGCGIRVPGVSALARMLSWRPLIWIGTMGYSVYLMHIPAIWLYEIGFGELTKKHFSFPMTATCVVALTLLLARIFHVFCERPFLTYRRGETTAEVARDAALSPAP